MNPVKLVIGVFAALLALMFSYSAKKGYGNFGKDIKEWKNSPGDDELVREEYEREREEYPELYEDD